MNASRKTSLRPPVVMLNRTRRPFGLDAPRPPDARRVEAEILAWLEAHIPAVLPLRIGGQDPGPRRASAATLALLLPGSRIAVLRIEAGPQTEASGACELAAGCRARRIPLARVANVVEARAALRRLGFEPEEF